MPIEGHDLDSESVEELFTSIDLLVLRHPSIKGRYVALGFVPDARFVLVVFEYDRETRWVRVVTAYEPTNPRWWTEFKKRRGRSR